MGIRQRKPGQSLGLGIIFLFLVGFLVLLSLGFKVATVIKNSNFDGENRFTLAVFKKNPQIITFSPQENKVFILNLNEPKDPNLGRLLAVPIDSSVSSEAITVDRQELSQDMFNLLLSLRDKDTDLTSIDVFRLFLFSRGVAQEDVAEEILQSYSLADIQRATLNNFLDTKVIEEKLQIEVVNATDVPGLANRLANYITNMGGNVILISTADRVVGESEIKYFGERTYTVSKLKRLLGFKDIKENKKNSISDVIITIGQEENGVLPF